MVKMVLAASSVISVERYFSRMALSSMPSAVDLNMKKKLEYFYD